MTEDRQELKNICPLCKTRYPEIDKYCPDDGTPLQIAEADVGAAMLAQPE